jgi:selenocysteine-specific elongation factor
MHITVGPTTGVAKVSFFGSVELKSLAKELVGKRVPNNAQDFLSLSESEYLVDAELKTGGKLVGGPVLQFVLLEFDAPVVCPNGVQLIGSRLDLNNETTFTCRIGFYGKVCRVFSAQEAVALPVKLFKHKEKVGAVDRIMPNGEMIGRGLFKRDTDITLFLGLKVTVRNTGGEELSGVIDSSFGKTGKFKVIFRTGTGETCKAGDAIVLKFKKYVGTSSKKIVQ